MNTINRTIKTPANNSQITGSAANIEGEDKKDDGNKEINIIEKINKDNKNIKNENNKLDESIASDITRPESRLLNKFKDMPSSKEKEFLQYYNNNDEKIQAKEFKYIKFIGKKPLNEKEKKRNILFYF